MMGKPECLFFYCKAEVKIYFHALGILIFVWSIILSYKSTSCQVLRQVVEFNSSIDIVSSSTRIFVS